MPVRRRCRSLLRVVWVLVVLYGLVARNWSVVHAAPRVRVLATTKLEVRGSEGDDGVHVFGKAADDTGRVLAGVAVTVSIAKAATPDVALRKPATKTTDSEGTFSLSFDLPRDAYVVTVRTARTPWLVDTQEVFRLEPGKRALEITFPPAPAPPSIVDLEQPELTFRVNVTADGIAQDGLELELFELRGGERLLAKTRSVRGTATFGLKTASLGAPGAAELAVVHRGSAGFAESRRTILSRRTAIARITELQAEDPSGGIPSEGIAVRGKVASHGGLPADGVVDAFLAGTRVGVATVEHGTFRLVARFRAERAGIATVTFRFTPHAEGWLPGESTDLPLQVRTPGPLRALLAAVLGVAVIAAVVRSRRAPKARGDRAALPKDGEVVHVTRKARAAKVVEITVRDRRRRTPVHGARVQVSRPLPTSVQSIGQGTSGPDGQLRLVLEGPARPGDQILVTHPTFLPLTLELPRAAELELSLTRRRDQAVDALLGWASQRLSGTRGRNATPGEVTTAARAQLPEPLAGSAATWADAVEAAAFGPSDVDERAHRRLERLREGVQGVGVHVERLVALPTANTPAPAGDPGPPEPNDGGSL